MTETPIELPPRWPRGPLRPFRSGQYRLLAGSLTVSLIAVLAIVLAKRPQDELAHPLDVGPDPDEDPEATAVVAVDPS